MMGSSIQTAMIDANNWRTMLPEESSGIPTRGELERMTRRRYQDPKPQKRGAWWTLRVYQDIFEGGQRSRTRKRVKLAPVIGANGRPTPVREVNRLASEYLRPMNLGLESIPINFRYYVENTYIPVVLPKLAITTQQRYRGVLNNYLLPSFGALSFRGITPIAVDTYFATLKAGTDLSCESIDKVRDVLASVLKAATRHRLIVANPLEGLELPRATKAKVVKPHITPERFAELLTLIPEPYATMIYVAVFSGIRVSELIGLKWEDVHADSITIDERYCRGDWAAPKSKSSAATIAVDKSVIERIQRLKSLTVQVKAGRATRKYKVVKADGPGDLVFQSVKSGRPMRDNNILTRFIKPAARKLGIGFVNWRCLRTSYATWMVEAGANPKDVQGQMRHSRISTTMDVYAQFVPESQRRAVHKMMTMVGKKRAAAAALAGRHASQPRPLSRMVH